MKKIKVLVLTPFFYPHVGGSQQYMEELYASLVKQYKNVSVEVLCYNTDAVEEVSYFRGLKINRIKSLNILPGQFAVPSPFHLLKFLINNRNSFDVIHSSTRFFDTSWWGVLYSKLINKPIILTDHCAFHPVHPNKVVYFISKIIDLTIVRFCLNYFNRIISTNKATQKFIKVTFKKDSEVIYGGIDSEAFKKATKKPGLNNIVYIGRIIDSKGVSLLFNYAKTKPNLSFSFAGPGYLTEKLKAEIKKLELNNIKMLGSLSKSEVAKLMRRSDILVHPSFHHEGFPNILTEAGASGLAVVATDTGGSKEIIINKKTGVLIEPNNQIELNKAIDSLISSKKLQKEYSENLYKHVKASFNWKKSAELQYKILQDLIK